MNKIALNILIATTILLNNGCMTMEGIDYTPSNNNTDKYVSIKEHNFQIWLKNQNEFVGNKGFYGLGECPDAHGHGMTASN
tara:strand:- start:1710 stop:1952 length:243 start_codon:yes stop_codon:yes gene_type:complete